MAGATPDALSLLKFIARAPATPDGFLAAISARRKPAGVEPAMDQKNCARRPRRLVPRR
jgi:hypothetical protein